MQLYGIRGENSWNKNRIPVTGDYGCWKKKSTRKQTFFVCLFVCFGFLDALWILCTSEFWKIPRRMYFSYGHTKCKLDLLVGSATAHKSNWGRRHLVGPYPQNTCSKEVAQNHEKWSSSSLSHQRGRTCLFRSDAAMKPGRDWLKISDKFRWLLHVSDREIHAKQLLAISRNFKKAASHPMNSSLLKPTNFEREYGISESIGNSSKQGSSYPIILI